MQAIVHEMNKVGAELAKKAAGRGDQGGASQAPLRGRSCLVLQAALCLFPPVSRIPPSATSRGDELVAAYKEQVSGLVDGGVDRLMIETVFDTQNCKAAIFAVDEYFRETKKEKLPVMLSATIVDNSGRTLSGQTIEAFYVSVKHCNPFTVGINCALGAAQMKGFYKKLADMNTGWCHVYPKCWPAKCHGWL